MDAQKEKATATPFLRDVITGAIERRACDDPPVPGVLGAR